jgi:hypothetical protein
LALRYSHACAALTKVAGIVGKVPKEDWATWVVSTNICWAKLPIGKAAYENENTYDQPMAS